MVFYRLFALSILSTVFISASSLAKDEQNIYELTSPQGCVDKNIITTKTVSLIDLIKIGICNNPNLNADYIQYLERKEDLSSAKSEYFPNIDLSTSFNKSTSKSQNLKTTEKDPYNINLGLSMLLYDFGGRSARIDSFKSYLANSGFEYNKSLQDLILSIHTAYFKLLGAKEDLLSAKANETMYKKSYDEAKRKYEVGLAALNDKLQTKTIYEQSKLKVIEMENAVKQNEGNLATILNLPPQTTFNLQSPPKDRDLTALNKEDTLDEIIEKASQNRVEIKAQEENINNANANLREARSSRFGAISFSVDSSYNNSWNNEYSYKRDNQIGINYRLPLFTGFETTHKIASAKLKRQKERYLLDELKNQIKNEVWSAYHNYQTSLKSYEVSKNLLKSAKENEKVAFKSYEVGQTDIINLLTAESQLAEARDTLVNAFYTVLINKATLYRSIGRF
ncbi:MAG: TolC family protein [Alphaproteobacteria bacterium]|nr:TolC family protein [Alphaproteobacteria bacterium]